MSEELIAGGCLTVVGSLLQPAAAATYLFLRATGDRLINTLTLQYFTSGESAVQSGQADEQNDEGGDEGDEDIVPGWIAALSGLAFWTLLVAGLVRFGPL